MHLVYDWRYTAYIYILFIAYLLSCIMLCLELIVHITYAMNDFFCSGWMLVGIYSRWSECPLKHRSKLHQNFPLFSPCDTDFQFLKKRKPLMITNIVILLQMIIIWQHFFTSAAQTCPVFGFSPSDWGVFCRVYNKVLNKVYE